MSEKLKPCPFCGNEDVCTIGNSPAYVYCRICGAHSDKFLSKSVAKTQWNRRASEWIKTSERLPERYDLVLIWIANNGDFEDRDIQIGWLHNTYSGLGIIWETESTYYKFSEVTHWMPLPEPPEVEK